MLVLNHVDGMAALAIHAPDALDAVHVATTVVPENDRGVTSTRTTVLLVKVLNEPSRTWAATETVGLSTHTPFCVISTAVTSVAAAVCFCVLALA